jgi:hypothetical protein
MLPAPRRAEGRMWESSPMLDLNAQPNCHGTHFSESNHPPRRICLSAIGNHGNRMAQRVHDPTALTTGLQNFLQRLATRHLCSPFLAIAASLSNRNHKLIETAAAPLRRGFRLFRYFPLN